MAGFGRGQFESGINAQGLAEFLAARALASRSAVDEREVFVRSRAVAVGQAEIDRRLDITRRFRVFAVVVLAHPGGEGRGALAGLNEFAQRRGGTGRQPDSEDCDQGRCKRRARTHRKRCWILTASPALTWTRWTCAGNVEFRISMVWAPAGTSSTRSGGLKPRLLPSTSTSPQGAMASSNRPAPAGTACFSGRLSRRAVSFFAGASAFVCGVEGAGGATTGAGACVAALSGTAGAGSSIARAPTPPATRTASTTPAATSAEWRNPSGPVREIHRAGISPSSDWVSVSDRRRVVGVPPTTE